MSYGTQLLHKYSQQELSYRNYGDPGTAPTCGYDGYSEIQKLLCKDIVDNTRICTDWIPVISGNSSQKSDCNYILLHFNKGNSGKRKEWIPYIRDVTLA